MPTRRYARESSTVARLIRSAAKQAERAYAPYSNFRVGSAVMTSDGSVFLGCNIENVSYGATLCAERLALGQAVAMNGMPSGITDLALAAINAAGEAAPCSPCGICRQVLIELAPDAEIHFLSVDYQWITRTCQQLVPDSFSKLR